MIQRLAALSAFVTAVALFGLGMLLASVARGAGASPALLAVFGVISETGMAVVLLYAFACVPAGPWAWTGRLASVAGMLLLFIGDVMQSDAVRATGNGIFYAALVLLGVLLWERHRGLGALALANGLVGFAFMAFAARLGLPELNLLLVVVWLAALGIDWLRRPWRDESAGARTRASQAA